MKALKLENTMTRSLLTVRWNLSLEDAWKMMKERSIRHLPVLDAEGGLIGILSDRDVKRAMDPVHSTFMQGAIVGDFMSWPILSVEQDASLLDALAILLEQKVSAVLVTKNNFPSGILTSEDLLRLLRDMLRDGESGRRIRLMNSVCSPYVQELIREASSAGI